MIINRLVTNKETKQREEGEFSEHVRFNTKKDARGGKDPRCQPFTYGRAVEFLPFLTR
jgi:hypothetical protein